MHITIIGHNGKMGGTFFKRFQEAGHFVNGIDIPYDDTELFKSIRNTEIILFCIPAKTMEEMCEKIEGHIPCSCILMDVTSVKVLPIKSMEKHYGGPVIGTHPLFGPRSLDYKKICLCLGSYFKTMDTEKQKIKDTVYELFKQIGCEPFYAKAEEHDKAMAALQGLNFVTNVAYFAMTANMPEIKEFLTPSFMRRLEAGRASIQEDGTLFTGIFEANPYSQDIVRQYRSFLNVAAGGDMDVLVKLAQKWFDK
ncbi:prephenate dehydrogenase [Taurinivorans muris]|uniref:Prephenate dehydrogenase n=1 Tax=Taurinivorans muris TaxID=2787751 RepID=A0ABY5Y1M3_9BACT|nr:prephenate dehydrogenase [Desulfovibrionaceae bacterium LT0009]